MYASAQNLIERFGADELSQRVDRILPRLVTPSLLVALATGGSLAGFTADAIASGNSALAIINRALSDADDCINAYLSGRYPLPLSSVPKVLSKVACELARYYLYDDMVTDLIKDRYEREIKFLREVSDGKASLGIDVAGAAPVSNNKVLFASSGKKFSRDNGSGFI